MPCLVRASLGDGRVPRLGHPLLDDYLDMVAARARPNTVLATAFDLKVFFTRRRQGTRGGRRRGRVRVHHRAAAAATRGDGGAARGRRGGAVGAHDQAAAGHRSPGCSSI